MKSAGLLLYFELFINIFYNIAKIFRTLMLSVLLRKQSILFQRI